MKSQMLVLVLFLFLFDSKIMFCQKELTGFRNASWGSSIDEVKALETANYMQSFKGFGIYALSYKSKLADLTVWIDYTFIEGKLVEGSYMVETTEIFRNDFNNLKDLLVSDYGNPNFRAVTDSSWVKENEYGKFKGPELYWQFNNGFIGLIASKFENEISITILCTCNKSIEEYNKGKEVSVDNFSNF